METSEKTDAILTDRIVIEKRYLILTGVVCALLLIISFMLGQVTARNRIYSRQAEAAAGGTGGQYSPLTERKLTMADAIELDESASDIVEKKEKPMSGAPSYETVMNLDWKFRSGEKRSENAYVENCNENTAPVTFTLTVEDFPDEVLYTSRELRVGEAISDIELTRALPDGVYEGTVTYNLLNEDKTVAGVVETAVTLHVGDGF